MPTYTVHEPPPRKSESVADPERFAFVRDGFHFWAFVFGPLWLLAHRLWLVLLLYVVINGVINVGLAVVAAPGLLKFAVALAIALLMGFEAPSLRRWTLGRRRWKTLGFVVGDNLEMAERRFYGDWMNRTSTPATSPLSQPEPKYTTPVRRGPPTGSDVIGLFPEPGA